MVSLAELASVAAFPDLEQILNNLGIPTVHTIADQLVNVVSQQIPAATFAQKLPVSSQSFCLHQGPIRCHILSRTLARGR